MAVNREQQRDTLQVEGRADRRDNAFEEQRGWQFADQQLRDIEEAPHIGRPPLRLSSR
jgi:hypothetical protein